VAQIPADLAAQIKTRRRKAAQVAIDRFEAAAKRSLRSTEHQLHEVTEGDAPVVFSTAARRFDLCVIMQSEPDRVDNDSIIEASLFGSGRPINIVPYIQRDGMMLDCVVCCWDGSRPAARAFNDALPFLTKAGAVKLLIVSNEKTTSDGRRIRGVEMAKHLARHDIKAEIKTTVASDIDVTDAILSYVADSSATMIVMGGYGHSRLREFILGGATRGILSSMTVPVLMSH
jgi:nucleotide-binding universal stress UspA family protein